MCLCACERRKLPQSLYTYIYVVCSDGTRARDPSIYAYGGEKRGAGGLRVGNTCAVFALHLLTNFFRSEHGFLRV